MARVLAVSNQKGGVGKTTTAVNLAASLAAAERRVLLIDLDPQGNAGSGLGVKREGVEGTIYEALLEGRPLAQLAHPTELRFLQVVPASPELTGSELELVGVERREHRLAEAVASVRGQYDHILIDCPPSLGLLTVNALVAADAVLVPLQCEYYALEGLTQLLSTVDRVHDSLNPNLELEGVVLTMFDARANISRQVADDVRAHLGSQVFESVVPRNVRLAESPSHGKPVLLYDIRSRGCDAYLALARELLAREGARGRRQVA